MSTSPPRRPHDELELADLISEAGELLADVRQADGRVAGRPDARLVRYYQSLGLLARPLRYDGGRAVYGRRHLLQLVAAKILQARGLSLAQIQAALAGATDDHLAAAVAAATGRGDETGSRDAGVERPLVAAEIAGGVIVTIDPRVVADPDAVLATLRTAIENMQGEQA